MVAVQVVNHDGCHQGLHVWESLWTLIRYWVLPRWMRTSAVKTGRAVLFSQTLEPLFILLRNVSARGWMMRSDNMRSCHLPGSRAALWSQPTCLHDWSLLYYTQADQGSAFPLPWHKGPQLHLFQLSVHRQKSLGLLFSDFLCTSGVLWFNPTGSQVPCNHWLCPPTLVHPKQSPVLSRRENLYPSQNQNKREDRYSWFLETCYFV